MIGLIILSAVLLIIVGVLFIPVVVDLKYCEDFKFRVKFLNIPIFKTKPPKVKKSSEESRKPKDKKSENSLIADTKAHFQNIKEKEGFTGLVKEIMAFVGQLLAHIKSLLRHINICKVKLDITVGTEDAAKTAYDYGLVCQAVYPVTAFLDSEANIGFKQINVNADFEDRKCDFKFKGTVKLQIFYLLVCAFKIYGTLKNFVTEKKENERQQH